MADSASDKGGLTVRAKCVLAAGLTAFVCGLVLREPGLTRGGLLAAALPLVALGFVHRARLQVGSRRSVAPDRVNAGESVLVQLVLRNASRLPTGTLMLDDQLPQQLTGRARFALDGLAGREERSVSYRIPALPRGRYRSGPLRARLTDPFHFVDVMRSYTATADFLVGPVIERLPGSDPPLSQDVGDNAGSHSIGSHGADDASTREYRVGDDLRKIHWRSTARTGALMVRQEERPWQGRGAVLLDLRASAHARHDVRDADPRRSDSLEWAVSAAASIATHLQLHRQDVELIFDATSRATLPLPEPSLVRDTLAVVSSTSERDLSGLTTQLAHAAREGTLFAILGTPDPVSLHALLHAHERRADGSAGTGLALVLDTPTWAGHAPEPDAGPAHDAARRLRAAGWRATVVVQGQDVAGAWTALVHGLSASSAAAVLR
jgi:uncharacterized protein (DUF58 family)